jgi:hypothetical protein
MRGAGAPAIARKMTRRVSINVAVVQELILRQLACRRDEASAASLNNGDRQLTSLQVAARKAIRDRTSDSSLSG